jgi:hypothetical protein
MTKRLLGFLLSAFLSAILLSIPLVAAAQTETKNNDKFQTFQVTATEAFSQTMLTEHEYIPSIDNINRLVITIPDEKLLTCTITIDGHTYRLGTDFAYTGMLVYSFNQPVFNNPKVGLLYPSNSNANTTKVEYTYDFSAYPGGIEGKLNMLGEFTAGGRHINSLSGTGDLQNVQIKAIAIPPTVVNGIVNINHEGTVIGWPE